MADTDNLPLVTVYKGGAILTHGTILSLDLELASTAAVGNEHQNAAPHSFQTPGKHTKYQSQAESSLTPRSIYSSAASHPAKLAQLYQSQPHGIAALREATEDGVGGVHGECVRVLDGHDDSVRCCTHLIYNSSHL